MNNNVVAVVVTYNRKDQLVKCVHALLAQTRPLKKIIIIDNNSTDGTELMFSTGIFSENCILHYVKLFDNIGGAGGFHEGIVRGLELGLEWFWLMDDDALPHPNALEELFLVVRDKTNIYGSLAKFGNKPSWWVSLKEKTDKFKTVDDVGKVPPFVEVYFLPFLGFLIHRCVIERIGLPEQKFFICCDDIEYCERAKKNGVSIYMAGKSFIEHPKARQAKINLFFRSINYLSLPPWKMYYDTRNRILLAKKHYGKRVYYKTLPGIFIRLIYSLIVEKNFYAQLRAYFAGLYDGLLGRGGRLHEKWKIK